MIITISRQYCAGGSALAARLADAIGWSLVDNDLIERVAARAGLTPDQVAARDERLPTFMERLTRAIAVTVPELTLPPGQSAHDLEERELVRITERVVAELAAEGHVILVGRSAPSLLYQTENALHLRLVASKLYRVHAASERLGIDAAEAARIVQDTDDMRANYHREYYKRDWADPANYHMVLNTELLGLSGAIDVVVARVKALGWDIHPREEEGRLGDSGMYTI